MLEDALGAGVMNELIPAYHTFLHGDLAPGAEPIGQVRVRCSPGSRGWSGRHARHSLRRIVRESTTVMDELDAADRRASRALPCVGMQPEKNFIRVMHFKKIVI
jgi:hypothetical protein